MKKVKQIMALICVIILISLYIITLIAAIFDHSQGMQFLKAAVFATVIIPVLFWAYGLIYRLTHPKDTSLDNETDSKEESKKS